MIVEKFQKIEFNDKTSAGYDKHKKEYGNKCPICGEKGKNEVSGLYEFWFCENPKCDVTCHFYGGYYYKIESDQKPVRILLKPDDVQLLPPSHFKKRSDEKILGVQSTHD